MIRVFFLLILSLFLSNCATYNSTIQKKNSTQPVEKTTQQSGYWQQRVKYVMDIDMDTQKHQYHGLQKLTYTNNSPDTLQYVYYHLYWNAFQPGSAMDWHARTLPDPDRNMDKTIQALKPDEIGFIQVNSLKQDSLNVDFQVVGTIMKVKLNKALFPGQATLFTMDYKAQVPKIIRRSGRNNKEGIDYSMAQWYPKMCEYDRRGWHTDPYVGREFYGVWGDYDVTIHIDKKYTVAATGGLMNPEQIGKGYIAKKPMHIPDTPKLTWHFTAYNVHDFSWAADPDYIHDIYNGPDEVQLHFFYQNDDKIKENWKKLQETVAKTMTFYNNYVGKYPYYQYSVIQAGDGGMEYAQCTFVSGNKPYNSLRGTVQHELGHAWFQFALATNESEYPWMDEGFTSFIQDLANVVVNGKQTDNPFIDSYESYLYLVNSKKEEPLSTHSDHYKTNLAYWINAYDKGKLVLSQLGYIMGFDKLEKTIKNYYKTWAMKHPQPDDFFRIAEKTSGMNLKWFQNEWIETTHHIDYRIASITAQNDKTKVILERTGAMPMPLDVVVFYKDNTKKIFHIPLDLTWGIKNNPFPGLDFQVLPVWEWAKPNYEFTIPVAKDQIKFVIIDPLNMMADINIDDNIFKNDKQ